MRDDGAGRLLRFAVRWMPAERREWGDAMLAELEQIEPPVERWRFALGCVEGAILMPGKSGQVLAMVSGAAGSLASRPNIAALTGLACVLPFAVLNAIVSQRIEPLFSWIRPGLHTSALEYALLPAVLLMMPVGAVGALLPSLRKGEDGRRRFYWLNGICAGLLLAAFAILSAALGSEIYACEVMQIPNCD